MASYLSETKKSSSFLQVDGQLVSDTDSETVASDNAALAALGYKQEFKRALAPLGVFAFSFSLAGIFPSIAQVHNSLSISGPFSSDISCRTVLIFALPYGGPVAMVWGWAISVTFIFCIGLALAELASSAPTSGGLYYWTWDLASPRWRKLLSWIVAYTNCIGLVAGFASVEWGLAVQIMAAVTIGTDSSFVPTTAQTFALYVALLIVHGFLSSLATSAIALLQTIYVAVNTLLPLAVVVAMPIATPKEFKNTAAYAFGAFTTSKAQSGWPNEFAFMLSFLAPLYVISGFESSIHMSEETHNARTAVPWAIVCTVGISSLIGWVVNVVFAFCMGTDIESIIDNPIGQPTATIFFNSFGRNGTLALWSLVAFAQFMVGANGLTVASRQMFAFARDRGLPFSGFIYRMNKRTQTPVNAVWVSAFLSFLLGLLAFAGPTAYSAIFTIALGGQYTAFIILMTSRFLGGKKWVPGPFTLGKFGLPVTIIAVAWMMFSLVILAFPARPGPSAESMNYMVVVYLGWLALCLVYYYFPVYGGARWFHGPQRTLEDVDRVGLGRAPA
ncbi:APC amino acid permease [Cubamyces lactineus]|nr:APC amino acid permease [Cubamyces lactineus]